MNPEKKILSKWETKKPTHNEGTKLAQWDTQTYVRSATVSQTESLTGPVTCLCQWLLVEAYGIIL